LLRVGLKDGDLLAYTGVLGESKRDLQKLFDGKKIDKNSRFYEPRLRSDFVYQAREYLRVGMDISDGLFCDTNKLLDINQYGVDIFKDIDKDVGLSGEEYEMLIGFDEIYLPQISKIAKKCNVELNIFAKIVKNDFRFECDSHHF
jgi:thiamine-monophosphate kinase